MCISEKDILLCVLILNWAQKLFLIIMFICFALSLYSLMFQLFTCNVKAWQWIRGKWALALCWLWPAQVSENWLLKAFSRRGVKNTKIHWQSVWLRTRYASDISKQKMLHICVAYIQKLQCPVAKPNQNIVTSVVVIHIFQPFLKQEIQCRRIDSSETLYIGRLKNPWYKGIICI